MNKFDIKVTQGKNCNQVEMVSIYETKEGLFYVFVNTKSKYIEHSFGSGWDGKRKYQFVSFFNEEVNSPDDVDNVYIYSDELDMFSFTRATVDSCYGVSFILFKDTTTAHGEPISVWQPAKEE